MTINLLSHQLRGRRVRQLAEGWTDGDRQMQSKRERFAHRIQDSHSDALGTDEDLSRSC